MEMARHSLTFVNHASVLITGETRGVLTDPWYSGDSFHKGWKLLHENGSADIDRVLAATSHIWLSHEHPDHFSIGFFKKYKRTLIERGISIIFQRTKDRRVLGFLEKEGFVTHELASNQPFAIEPGFSVRLVKDEFYDSALICKVGGVQIFNLNDCPMHSASRIQAFKRKYGTCDILLTQFSYAAWKGGKANRTWRSSAAREKLESLVRQGTTLGAKLLIPFASYVWFSNELNFYLNDAANTPRRVVEYCAAERVPFACCVPRPMETIPLDPAHAAQDPSSLTFWDEEYRRLGDRPRETYGQSFDLATLTPLFETYCRRLKLNNSWPLIRLIGNLRFLGIFRPIAIKLSDTHDVILVDLPNNTIGRSSALPDVELHSESLAFVFKNAFGFDTLTVNGTFEEMRPGGFARFTKTFAVENLNNLGFSLRPSLFLNIELMSIFAARLAKVAKKLR
jgi:hypothetical protein